MSTITQTLTPITPPIIATSVDALSPASILAYVESQQTYDSSITNTLIPQMNTIIGQTNIVIGELNTLASGVSTNAGIATTKASESSISAAAALVSQNAASVSAATCADFAGAFVSTSTTSVLIGTGSKSFTTQTGEQYSVGAFISIAYTTTPTNFMHGQVTSYDSGTGALVVDVQSVGGSGTFALWNISLSGARGATGASGDHGLLTGLTDDDHTQYHNDTRGDARYLKLTGGSLTGALNTARATVASSATTSQIWTALGNQIDWTGTATTTAFPTAPQAGAERTLICAGACSFTAGANMLIDGVASGSTVTCAVNDTVIVRAVSTTQFKLTRIKYDGTAQVTPAGGAWEIISTTTVSAAVAQVDIEHAFDTTYKQYKIIATRVVQSATDVMRLRLKSGGAYQTGSLYDVGDIFIRTGGTYGGDNPINQTSIRIDTFAQELNEENTYEITIPPLVNTYPSVSYISLKGNGTEFVETRGVGIYKTAGSIQGVRFFPNTGNITSGTFTLIGLK